MLLGCGLKLGLGKGSHYPWGSQKAPFSSPQAPQPGPGIPHHYWGYAPRDSDVGPQIPRQSVSLAVGEGPSYTEEPDEQNEVT